MSDKIAEAFGIEPTEIIRPPKIKNQVPSNYDDFTKQMIEHRKSDYGTVRDNFLNLLQEMDLVVDSAIDEVRSNPSARMIEAFSALVKTYSEINKDLLSVSDKPEISEKSSQDQKPVNNNIFIGTSDNLIDLIRKNS